MELNVILHYNSYRFARVLLGDVIFCFVIYWECSFVAIYLNVEEKAENEKIENELMEPIFPI